LLSGKDIQKNGYYYSTLNAPVSRRPVRLVGSPF
jgi:hypothetical protein